MLKSAVQIKKLNNAGIGNQSENQGYYYFALAHENLSQQDTVQATKGRQNLQGYSPNDDLLQSKKKLQWVKMRWVSCTQLLYFVK